MLKIGLSSCFFHADPLRPIFKGKTLIYAEQSLVHWVMSQGALAFLIPPPSAHGPVSMAQLVREMDGLVLQGGSDVAPESYGDKPLRPEWRGDAIRDGYEIALMREFLSQGKPVLGICRGMQLLNVALGGTLHQDIATQLPAARNHRDWEIYDRNFHDVEFTTGSRLAHLYPGVERGKVNTVHHQGIQSLGKGLRVEAVCAEDGMIEAVRLDHPREWLAGVQWHPEFHDPQDESLLDPGPILTDFLRVAREKRIEPRTRSAS